jgi:hypothetical protein
MMASCHGLCAFLSHYWLTQLGALPIYFDIKRSFA